jgi:hypothetical protein
MPSTMDMNERTLYLGLKPTGTKAEKYSAERKEAKRASTSNASNVRITDKENLATKTEKVHEALMEESRAKAKKPKSKGNGNMESCGGMYEYCEIEAITPTHVAYKQGPDLYGRTYMYDVGTGEVELGPRMTVHQELVFGKPDAA